MFSPGRGERTHLGSLTGSSAWSPGRVVSEPPEGGRGCAILRWNQGLVLLPCGQLQDCNFPGQSILLPRDSYSPICKMGLACKGLKMGKGPRARNPCLILAMLRSRHALMALTMAEGPR